MQSAGLVAAVAELGSFLASPMKAAIKTTGFALVLFLATSLIHAEEFIFQYQRFGHISLETAKGKERVVILAYGKADSDDRG